MIELLLGVLVGLGVYLLITQVGKRGRVKQKRKNEVVSAQHEYRNALFDAFDSIYGAADGYSASYEEARQLIFDLPFEAISDREDFCNRLFDMVLDNEISLDVVKQIINVVRLHDPDDQLMRGARDTLRNWEQEFTVVPAAIDRLKDESDWEYVQRHLCLNAPSLFFAPPLDIQPKPPPPKHNPGYGKVMR